MVMYHIVDLYGQVPFREANASFDTNPRVLSRAEATQFIVDDLTAAIPGLPTTANASQTTATRAAGQFLMAKVMLNKAVFVQNPQQPQGPYTFAQGDMNAVIANCDAIINSGTFALEPSGQYFDNFHWDNTTLSRELVFALRNDKGAAPANARNRFYMCARGSSATANRAITCFGTTEAPMASPTSANRPGSLLP